MPGTASGLGLDDYEEEYSLGKIGAEIHAKAGDEVRVSWTVSTHPGGGTGEAARKEIFRKRVERAGPVPKDKSGREEFIRHVTLDLLGVVPTPEEVGKFVNDDSPEATGKLVTRLLASPANVEEWNGSLETGTVVFRVVLGRSKRQTRHRDRHRPGPVSDRQWTSNSR